MAYIRSTTFPKKDDPPTFIKEIIKAFERTTDLDYKAENPKEYTSDAILKKIGKSLSDLGFDVEKRGDSSKRIKKSISTGNDAQIQYFIDAYHPVWRCGLEVEAGRGWKSNAVYRNIVQSILTLDVDHLVIAVRNEYRSKKEISKDYDKLARLCDALYSNNRIEMPVTMCVIGYGMPAVRDNPKNPGGFER